MKIYFEDIFSQTLLDRGYDYYLSGLVEKIKVRDNCITAIVCGSEDYELIGLQWFDLFNL